MQKKSQQVNVFSFPGCVGYANLNALGQLFRKTTHFFHHQVYLMHIRLSNQEIIDLAIGLVSCYIKHPFFNDSRLSF